MKKGLKIFIVFIIGIIILGVAIFFFVSATSKKLVCKSSEGNITILYNDDTLTGYTASGLTYDLDGQTEIAENIGVEAYLDEFSFWFRENTTGTCKK